MNIVLGSLTALGGVVILVATGSLAGVIAASINAESDSQSTFVAAPIIAAIGIGIAIFFVVLGLPAILGAWGLLNYRPWSRVLMLIVSAFHLLHIPIGTALGVYGLWVLTSEDGRRLLQSGGVAVPPAYPNQYAPAAYPQPYSPPPGPPPPAV
ncbi:MAG TPA: hypothetical protein VHZ55_01010 [Bryobacteraceae bacterium]|nr:hypothetical protein [Bryobacteraceae bacterium]